MNIVMIYDQIQSGMGTKDDFMLPLGGKKEAVGPAVMMQPFLSRIGARVTACLYCGNGCFMENPETVCKKLSMMVQKLKPDAVICGPAFNYTEYARMCAAVAEQIQKDCTIPVFAAMSEENEETLQAYREKIAIVRMPKKGGAGLNDSLKNMCRLAEAVVKKEDVEKIRKEVCY
ncbi:GrdB-related putative oxidoreductase [Lachnospiraceae bacterium 54-53]